MKFRQGLIHSLLLCIVLAAGAYFRFTGLMWGDEQYPHPDERFLVWVTADIAQVESPGDYFNTAKSTMNPANRGHGFFVYGTLPVFATRILVDTLSENPGWEQIAQVGRGLSVVFDLVTVFLVYLIAVRLFGKWTGLLAGMFSATAVLQIQLAHYYTVDSFATTFTTLAVFLAIRIVLIPGLEEASDNTSNSSKVASFLMLYGGELPVLRESALFGIAVGAAMACKLNTAPVALLLPVALGLRYIRVRNSKNDRDWMWSGGYLLVGGLVAFLVFRVLQPYAFKGPSFFDMLPDTAWMQSIRDQRSQASGDVDFPPALQWAKRNHLFSFQNLTLWGLGLPLGITAWCGFLGMAFFGLRKVFWRSGPARESFVSLLSQQPGEIILWGWTTFYFIWQSAAWNPTMRYQLPIYPTLAILAAWGVMALGRWVEKPDENLDDPSTGNEAAGVPRWLRLLAGTCGLMVVVLTLGWAQAFTRIYNRTETRLAASLWIYENVPGPVNLELASGRRLLPINQTFALRTNGPYQMQFASRYTGSVTGISLPAVRMIVEGTSAGESRLTALLKDLDTNTEIGHSEAFLEMSDQTNSLDLVFDRPASLEEGRRYGMELRLEGPDTNWVELSGQIQLTVYHQVQQAERVVQIEQNAEQPVMRFERRGTLRMIIPQAETQWASGISEGLITLESTIDHRTWSALTHSLVGSEARVFVVDPPLTLEAGVPYRVTFSMAGTVTESGLVPVPELVVLDQAQTQSLPPFVQALRSNDPWILNFTPESAEELSSVSLWRAAQFDASAGTPAEVRLMLQDQADPTITLAQSSALIPAAGSEDPRGAPVNFVFDPPVALSAGHTYLLKFDMEGAGLVMAYGSAPANESDWDMGLPFRGAGYDGYGGIYQRDLNFQMYWDDDASKYQRFVDTLDQADYFFISSNRQWGTTTRVSERYPLTTEFYRLMMGCPTGIEVVQCYNTAEVRSHQGELGFKLVQVFESYPNLGPIKFNTQFAEEAFSVYDHPKVFIFQKQPEYNPARVRELLGAVDTSHAAHVTPRKASGWSSLLLPADRMAGLASGGTWAELFPPDSWLNRSQVLAVVVWWLFLTALGWLVFPLVRLALPGLADWGFPLARIFGLLLLAYPVWLAGSAGVPVTRWLITAVVVLLAAAGLLTAYRQRADLLAGLRQRWRTYAGIECLALLLFTGFLLVRLGNPDLWHVIFGGEKPMDFSYFNAVLKSTTFPPYDPWFAGGSLNYYYYGFVIVGMPVKLLGITPSVAYNLILPSLFSITALGAFSIGWNLNPRAGWRTGIFVTLALVVLGNQGAERMIWEGWQKLAAPQDIIAAANFGQKIAFGWQGMIRWMGGVDLPYPIGDWYWIPSRAIIPASGGEITEFPLFTFLYGDPHAHMIALPITLLVIAWALSVILSRGRWKAIPSAAWGLAMGALFAGTLRAANSWDHPTYLAVGTLALLYARLRWFNLDHEKPLWLRLLSAVALPMIFIGLSFLFVAPFDHWFRQGYTEIKLWDGDHANLSSYLVHWGLFLFLLAVWLLDETIDWMAATPMSALKRLQPYTELMLFAGLAVTAVFAWMVIGKIQAAWLVVPMGLACLLLLFRRDQPEEKRLVLFLAGTGLALTLAVEVIALQGDRMNTVFKFYFQAWTLLAISAGAALAWLLKKIPGWGYGQITLFSTVLAALTLSAALTTTLSAVNKINDRQSVQAPHTLDGMTYMAYTQMLDGPPGGEGREMDLSADYRAIQWMQRHVDGSPVIVEAHTGEYRHWGNRFTIYTGLPGILGWENHQRQQRGTTPARWIDDRLSDIQAFYLSSDRELVRQFLDRYQVEYIIVGQLERLYYPGKGLIKFHDWEGDLWEKVYSEGETEIYRVK